jgi:hypothetical protein
MMKTGKLIFVLLCLCCSCNRQGSNRVLPAGVVSIPVYPAESRTVTIDDIYAGCTFIRLETNPESLLSYVNTMRIYKNRIYLYDNGNKPAVFCFDMQGKFLFKIAGQGQGPGEAGYIAKFCIDGANDLLWIADNFRKILKYDLDGHFIQEYRTDFAINDIACLPGSKDLFAIRFGYYENHNYETGVYSLSGKQILTHRDYASTFERIVSGGAVMSEYRGNLVYASGFTDTLYYMDETGFYPQYAFDFGKYKMPEDIIRGKDNRNIVVELNNPANNYAGLIAQPIETDEYVTFNYSFGGEHRISIYSKEQKAVRTLDKILMDNEELFLPAFFMTCHEGCYYSAIYPENISGIMEAQTETSGYGVYGNFAALKSALKADDNPVIVFGKSNIHTLFQ